MPLHSVIGAALTDHSARHAMLTVAGVDLLLDVSGTPGQRLGIPIESIVATERGPAGVSDLRFTLWDPANTVTLARNQPVYYSKTAEAVPVFQGFVTSWKASPLGSTGKTCDVRCTGLEAVLDWAKVDAVTIPASTRIDAAVQLLAGSTLNGLAFPLNTLGVGSHAMGDNANPISALGGATIGPTAIAITAGTTLREAIRTVTDDGYFQYGASDTIYCTVSSLGGLRVFPATRFGAGIESPGDFFSLYVVDAQSSPAEGTGAVGSPMVSRELDYEQDATAPTAVYVQGSGVSVLVEDATGDVGNLAVISDSTLTTAAQCEAAGQSYLAKSQQQLRASFWLRAKTPIPSLRAGSVVTFTDALVGASALPLRLWEIQRTFFGQKEHWRLTVGGAGRPSHVVEMRRLTRGILS